MYLLIKWILGAIAILISAYLIPGVEVAGPYAALWVVLFLGFINIVLKPILIFFTLPINIITLGLFTFIINAGLVLLTSSVIEGFEVDNFFTALIFSIVLTIVGYILNTLFLKK